MLLLIALACTNDTSTCATEGDPGTLTLTFDVPDEAWTRGPEVLVIDADGATVATLTPDDAVVEGIAPGPYSLVAKRAIAPDPAGGDFSELAYGGATDPVASLCVDGDSTATVTYALQPSSGHLFATSFERIAGFARPVAGGDNVAADIALDLSLVNGLNAIHFDAMGNLWAAAQATYGARLLVFTPASVDGVGARDPDFELAVPDFADNDSLTDFAFADDDSLWVSVAHDDAGFVGLYHFSAAQVFATLRGESLDAPAETFTVAGLVDPQDLLFGADGALWIADFAQNTVLRVELGGGGTQITPTHTVSVFHDAEFTTPYAGPSDLMIDDAGGLWVNWWTDGALVRLANPQDGQQLPDSVYHPDTDGLVGAGLAADLGGGLWYGQETGGATGMLHRMVEGALAATVTTPDALSPGDLVVDPAP